VKLAIVVLSLAAAAGCKQHEGSARAAKLPALAQTGTAQPGAGTSGFYLELATLYERYGDLKTAGEDLQRAIDKADNPATVVQAYVAMARLREAGHDKAGAITALERAIATKENGNEGPRLAAFGNDDPAIHLSRLYIENGRIAEAQRLIDTLLANADPYRLLPALRAQIDLYRQTNTLADEVARRERALDDGSADERALRFLALVYETRSRSTSTPGAGDEALGNRDKLVHVYERLHQLRADDQQIRQLLLGLYEQAGKVDAALTLLATTPPVCVASNLPIPALANEAEAIRLLLRVRQYERAQTRIGKLLKRANDNRIGIAAYISAAALYADAGNLERATATLTAGRAFAHNADDKRALATAQAALLSRTGKTAELKSLYDQWQRSDDDCLRAEARRRAPLLAQIPAAMQMGLP
jgi:tetratricopeptide (TPR) repeat protein